MALRESSQTFLLLMVSTHSDVEDITAYLKMLTKEILHVDFCFAVSL